MERHYRLLFACFCLYFFFTLTSRAGMEAFAWLTVAVAILYFLRISDFEKFRKIAGIYPWKILSILLAIVIAGLVFNSASDTNFGPPLFAQRYMILLFAWAMILSTDRFNESHFKYFLIVIGLISLYAIFQSITGLDLLRPGSNRAVHQLSLPNSKVQLWRSAGLYDSPTHYAYAAGMQASLALAYAIVSRKKKIAFNLFGLSLLVYTLAMTSVITTYTRGAWAGLAVSGVAMATLVQPKIGLKLAAVGAIIVTLITSFSPSLRERLFSVFDLEFSSNSDRLFLWKINWEMFKDYPILGIGYGQNQFRAQEYATKFGQPDAFLSHAHNNYLEMLTGTGATGLAAYLALIIFMLSLTIKLFRKIPENNIFWRTIALGAFGAQLHLHVGGLTEANFKSIITNHHLVIAWAFVIAGTCLFNDQNRTETNRGYNV